MLEIRGLCSGYGRAQVLFDVDVAVGAGQVACVMGRNGVGKTTLLNTVMGLVPAVRGTVVFDGTDITRTPTHARVRSGMGYAPQGHETFAPLTVWENLRVAADGASRGAQVSIEAQLELFPRLKPLLKRRAGLLSGGQAQQLAIARALVADPRLLVLDEPTEGIQPSIVAEIAEAIARVAARGVAVLLVEQYLDVALGLADTVTVMDAGRVVYAGEASGFSSDDAARLLAV
ncbi:ATP-binding cassette domain-containing protein [Thermobifida halotolerans]|uniref:ATP-binding cassette domain-containing protein n=1 Tax=Thermobifida halotolerans TaxID=483545 RepID=A0A399G809_9ACTN|nr:ATP-binding cassette domain-containing protein [Thermobifida halotolerans]UOE21923.1 ATP-binding cassette domain-containing protein [Thermobifida halotolerans]